MSHSPAHYSALQSILSAVHYNYYRMQFITITTKCKISKYVQAEIAVTMKITVKNYRNLKKISIQYLIECKAITTEYTHLFNLENKKTLFKGLMNNFCYRRISISGGSIITGFNCMHFFYEHKVYKYNQTKIIDFLNTMLNISLFLLKYLIVIQFS